MKISANQPIGIFDSGVGGLTVAGAIKNLLPEEDIIYFGDTAHLPYGDKSSEAIKYYSTKITDFLIENQCKIIVIACNTASAHAFRTVKEHVAKTIPELQIVNVIDPAVDYVTVQKRFRRIGVIGTRGTITSGTYQRKIKEKMPETQVISFPTRLFVPMIEEGFIYDDISNAIIRSYLSNEQLKNVQALILGCTHYPIIKNQIRKFYNFEVKVVDSSQIVAKHLKKILTINQLQQTDNATPEYRFFVSDYTKMFENIAQMFFDDHVNLKQINLWK